MLGKLVDIGKRFERIFVNVQWQQDYVGRLHVARANLLFYFRLASTSRTGTLRAKRERKAPTTRGSPNSRPIPTNP